VWTGALKLVARKSSGPKARELKEPCRKRHNRGVRPGLADDGENLAVWNSECLVLGEGGVPAVEPGGVDSSPGCAGGSSVGPSVNCWRRLALLVLEEPVAESGATSGLIIACKRAKPGPEIKPARARIMAGRCGPGRGQPLETWTGVVAKDQRLWGALLRTFDPPQCICVRSKKASTVKPGMGHAGSSRHTRDMVESEAQAT
jgi:hypothetical protein